ncbi:MAG TPA: Spy/CpxP family protein refolding chaperone [Pyrinomonadaceae bacterium]|nr:Spy/CpxP family protein refolding chaperone [Pyrinomonadaceae bacterium]
MKKRILVIASIAVLTVAATILALAQGHMGGEKMRGGPGDMLEHISRELNLTDAQKAQAKAIFDSQKAAGEERHAKLEAIHNQLEESTAKGQFDETKVRELANQQAALMADEMVEHMRMHSQLYNLLTAEQKTKADEMMKMHGGGPGGPGGPHHHRGGPDGPPPGF